MSYKVPFLDLRITDKKVKKSLLKAIDRVFTHGRIILGPEVEKFEKKVADYCGRKYAVGVNSGTDALILGLKSLGIGQGDEVITTSLSWVATANSIALIGAQPVFADILDDLNIDPVSVEKMITDKTKAIMPVHYTGRVCNMDDLGKISRKYKIPIIEDASQSFGALRRCSGQAGWQKAGSWGKVVCFSMNPMKILGGVGEAGVILTDEYEIYDKLIDLRYNGTVHKEECRFVSLNGKIDTIQAAVLLERFRFFEDFIERRRKNASFYFAQIKNVKEIKLPYEKSIERNIYYTFTLRAENRDKLKEYLEKCGIETKIQHPILMADQPVYRNYPRDNIKNAKKILTEILCIPIHEKLRKKELVYIANSIKKFYSNKNSTKTDL
jgi:dTDP-4-amino-4,6-dideoxygalactose transaminase